MSNKFKLNQGIFYFFTVLIPYLLIWFFLGRDVFVKETIPFWSLALICFSLSTILIITTGLLIHHKKLSPDIVKTLVPTTFIFDVIILTFDLSPIWRFGIVIVLTIVLSVISIIIAEKMKKR